MWCVLVFHRNCYLKTSQSALRRTFAWKTGNNVHCAVSRNSTLRVHHDDVIYYSTESNLLHVEPSRMNFSQF